MSTEDEFHPRITAYRDLTLEERARWRRQAIRRAHAEQARLVRALFEAMGSWVRRSARLAGRWHRTFAAWRMRRAAVAELQGLDDRALKDLGIRRGEIEAVVRGWGSDATRRARGPDVLLDVAATSPLTAEHKRLVKETWRDVVPIADTAAELFYKRLFEIDPSTRRLFRADRMAEQRRKLVQTLALVVQGIDNLDALMSTIEELGRRHAGNGVTDAHYDLVAAALIWTLEQGLGRGWTPAAAAAWTELYGLLAGAMRKAARGTEAAPTPMAA